MLSSAVQMAQTRGWVKQSFNQDTGDFPASGEKGAPVPLVSKTEGENSSTVFTRAQLLDRAEDALAICISDG